MKKLGAWLIKTSHAIARWWGKLTKGFKCNWNKIIFAVSFKIMIVQAVKRFVLVRNEIKRTGRRHRKIY